MKDEEYEDYLVDKAKELLNEELSDAGSGDRAKPEMKEKRNRMDEKAEKESTDEIPMPWDPQEIEHLVNNRKKMDNDDMKEFLERDSDLQEDLREVDEWNGFSRWEERFMVQNHLNMDPEGISEELERDPKEVRLKMRMLGLQVE
ncbi:MAG: hypothetical protein ABEI58_04310 [Candidatus Nanohaloarchaea archaeon]